MSSLLWFGNLSCINFDESNTCFEMIFSNIYLQNGMIDPEFFFSCVCSCWMPESMQKMPNVQVIFFVNIATWLFLLVISWINPFMLLNLWSVEVGLFSGFLLIYISSSTGSEWTNLCYSYGRMARNRMKSLVAIKHT